MSAMLPRALVWLADGHLTEEALVALGDGQDIVPAEAASHADACDECARRMGEAALLSCALGPSLAGAIAAAPAPASQRAAPLPIWALVFGLGFVGFMAVPLFLGMGAWLPRALFLQRSVPVFAHGLLRLFAGMGGTETLTRVLVTLGALAVLMMSYLAVSRLSPREGVAQ